MEAAELLSLCLQQVPPLMEWIYIADYGRRWLHLLLRWRLVSRRYNQMILQKNLSDQFNRNFLRLYCDLERSPSINDIKFMRYWPQLGYFNYSQRCSVFDILLDVTNWDSFAMLNPWWNGMIEHIGRERIKYEYVEWKKMRPRIRKPLPKRPADMHPNVFLAAVRFRMRTGRFSYPRMQPRQKGSRCSMCFRVTRFKGHYEEVYLCNRCAREQVHFTSSGAEFSTYLMEAEFSATLSKKQRLSD